MKKIRGNFDAWSLGLNSTSGLFLAGYKPMKQYYYFGAIDYTIFSLMLVAASSVGIYLNWRSKVSIARVYKSSITIFDLQDKTVDDFQLGGRKMHAFPTSLSMMSTSLSAITILGTPAEFFDYGFMYMWMIVANACGLLISAEVFVPIFYRLKVRTTYEYLEMRFNGIVRKTAVTLYLTVSLIFTGLAVYAPATGKCIYTMRFLYSRRQY